MARPEDSRVKIPALVHFTRLGYQYMSIKDMVRGVDYDSDTNIFYGLFLDAINKINNTDLSLEEAKKIIEELKIKLSNDDLGKAFFEILQKGYNGIKLIDYSPTKDKNSYVVVTELPYENGDDNFRPDIIVLINGMPLSFVEVKRQNNREGILAERERMTRRFSNPIYKKFVNLTQYTVFSNNNEYDDTDIEPIQGAFYASSNYGRMFFSKFREQRAEELDKGIKEIDEDVEKFILKDNNLLAIKGTSEYASSIRKDSPTNRIVTSLYSRDRLRFILQYGLCYKETVDKNGIKHIEKHIMRYPQIFATLAIRVRLSEGVKKGVIWHTQGSGKTALAFSNVHFLRDYYQNQGKIAKFYFIVDRLDLATQAKAEFEARGLKVNMISSKEDFKTNIAAVGETDNTGKTSITVVNIQKFSDESVTKQSDYNVSVQRVYFLDEAHRSYNPKGSFLANLMASDRDAVMIALTGTPLIGDGYNTKDVFGNYIHKYYYNQSIADGYTLKLIREEIETKYKTELASTLEMLEVQHGSIEKKELYAHPKFVSAMVDYIVHDFEKGRTTLDDSIGAMIVCDSAPQARAVSEQLSRIAKYSHALVLHDEGTKQDRKDIQEDFKKGKIDILVVYNMLLTGFDAPRLKRLYFGRKLKDHNLLQAITRVNRPYKENHYGYVIDFANIKRNFEETNEAYLKELNRFNDPNEVGAGNETDTFKQVIEDPAELIKQMQEVQQVLFNYTTDNAEEFSSEISTIEDKQELLKLKKIFIAARDCCNLVRTFGDDELKETFAKMELTKLPSLISEVQHHIDNINQKELFASDDTTKLLVNEAMEDITFNFSKISEEELKIVGGKDAVTEKYKKTVRAFTQNIDPDDPEFITLQEAFLLRFKQHGFEPKSVSEIEEQGKELEDILKKLDELQKKNTVLLRKYNGDAKFARVHKRIREENLARKAANKQPIVSEYDMSIMNVLLSIKFDIDQKVYDRNDILKKDAYFERTVMTQIKAGIDKLGIASAREDRVFIQSRITKQYLDQYNQTYSVA